MHLIKHFDSQQAQALALLRNLSQSLDQIRIGMIDGAVDISHPEFSFSKISQYYDNGLPTSHGTAVASLLVGQNCGLVPDVELIVSPAFFENQQGTISGCSEVQLASKIRELDKLDCNIINISGASLSTTGRGSQELRSSVKDAINNGTNLVAAIGNEATLQNSVPAALPHVIAVGGHDDKYQPVLFNNKGSVLKKKTILAPATNIRVADVGGGLKALSGTSFATPIVSGITAMILGALKAIDETILPAQLAELFIESALPAHSSEKKNCADMMQGRLDLRTLVKALLEQKPNLLKLLPPQSSRRQAMNEKTFDENNASSVRDASISHHEQVEPSSSENLTPKNREGATPTVLQQAFMPENSIEIQAGAVSTPEVSPQDLELPQINDPASNISVHSSSGPTESASAYKSASANKNVISQSEPKVLPQEINLEEKVFAIGQLGYDFGTEARLDYFTQVMGGSESHPYDPEQLAAHLFDGENIEQSNALIWTLKIDGIPVYAIDPQNQFAYMQYSRLVEFLHEQEQEQIEQISIAGIVSGEKKLFNGQVIPAISPVLRGMFSWKAESLAQAVIDVASQYEDRDGETTLQEDTPGSDKGSDTKGSSAHAIEGFLKRIYYELRNKGLTSQERAINFAATNAYQMKEVFDDALQEDLFLNKISATESPVSRPESDCWDVVLEFFNPKERLTAARKLYRYTIDVSDIIPVTVGELRSWHAY